MDLVVDTSFLIARWRAGHSSPEQAYIDAHPDMAVVMPWIVKAEFLRGAAVAGHTADDVNAFIRRFPTLWADDETVRSYVQIHVALRRVNQMIGPHDLWIAAAAIRHGLPLLTRNRDEFSRVAGLEVIGVEATT